MMRKTFTVAILTLMSLCLFSGPILAKHFINDSQPIAVQDEEYLPYDQWYGPDDTIDYDEDRQPDRRDVPELPDNDERVAPEEDTRPQAR